LRQQIYAALPESFGALKVWKHRSPPRIDDKRVTLEPVQYSVAVENSQNAGYYSEKLVDCFIAKTFPLYWGCTTLDRYFDPKGYLCFLSVEHLMRTLTQLTPEFYESRLPAVEHNFNVALQSVHQWDLINNAISEGIQRKKQEGSKREEAVVPSRIEQPRLVRPLHRPLRRVG